MAPGSGPFRHCGPKTDAGQARWGHRVPDQREASAAPRSSLQAFQVGSDGRCTGWSGLAASCTTLAVSRSVRSIFCWVHGERMTSTQVVIRRGQGVHLAMRKYWQCLACALVSSCHLSCHPMSCQFCEDPTLIQAIPAPGAQTAETR